MAIPFNFILENNFVERFFYSRILLVRYFNIKKEMPTKKKNTKKTVKSVTAKNMKKNTEHPYVSLLLPRHMFDTDKAQLVVSLLMLTILIVQVYLFVNIYELLGIITELQTT